MNYKIRFTGKLVMEPYCGFSFPLVYEWTWKNPAYFYPTFTIGARIGINRLTEKRTG